MVFVLLPGVPWLFVSKYEMTQGQWQRLGADDPSAWGPRAPHGGSPEFTVSHPVENVSLKACHALLRAHSLRLPTDGEWMHAAMGRFASDPPGPWLYLTGAEDLGRHCNLADRAAVRESRIYPEALAKDVWDDGWPLHAPVGSFEPNRFGLHDIIGNVWEYTEAEAGARIRGGGYETRFRDLVSDSQNGGYQLAYGAVPDLGLRPVRVILSASEQRRRQAGQ